VKVTSPRLLHPALCEDMGIALLEARRMKLSLPGLALVNQFIPLPWPEGLETSGTQALYKVLDQNESVPESWRGKAQGASKRHLKIHVESAP